jgi:phosphatidylserine/phosphatidylglycerophosphate/cardiolipin synthase-like enzyme
VAEGAEPVGAAGVLDLGARPVRGGFFLRRRSGPPDPFVPAPEAGSGEPYRHCFTYWGSEHTIQPAVLDLIAGAKRKVFLASFLIGDDALHDALVAAAQRLVGGVYVITQLDDRRLRRGLADLGQNPGVGLQSVKKRFDQMTTQGIYVRGHPSCHAKFLVVDDRRALVSSANLMTDAFVRTGENGVVVTDPGEAERLARWFARLWHQRCRREALPGRSYSLKKVVRDASPGGERRVTVPPPVLDGRAEIVWTDGDDGEQHILATIHDVLDRAQREVLLATFSLVGMRRDRGLLLDRIVAAVDRGARVRLLVRPRRDRDDHVADIAALAAAGVEVHGDTETHMKGVIADGRHGALFSANFDSEHGLTTGVEAGVRLDGTPALGEARRLFAHALDQATLSYALDPTHEELSRGLDVDGGVAWPLDRDVHAVATPEHRARFARAAREGPVLFTEPTPDRVTLHAGRTRWHLVADDPDRTDDPDSAADADIADADADDRDDAVGRDGTGGRDRPRRPRRPRHRLRPAPGERHEPSAAQLQTWLTRARGPARGVCPARFTWHEPPA